MNPRVKNNLEQKTLEQKSNKGLIVICVLIISITVLVYWNTFKNDFVWDDRVVIVGNDFIKQWENIPLLLSKKYFVLSQEGAYRPIATLSLFVDYQLWKLNPVGWHLTNILFHAFNGILIYLFAKLITKNKFIAVVSGLIFVVHPISTETVNVVSFREDLICLLFFLSSIIFYIKSYDDILKNKKIFFYILSLTFFIFSLFAKEMAVTLPFILILYDYSFQKTSRNAPRFDIKRYIPFFIVLSLYLFGRFLVFNPAKFTDIIGGRDFSKPIEYMGGNIYTSMLTMCKVTVRYLWLLIYPLKLSADHLVLPSFSIFEFPVISSIIILVGILISAVLLKKYSKELSFCVFLFFVSLLPVSHIIPIGVVMAERFLYIPSIGFCLFLSMIFGLVKKVKFLYLVLGFLIMFYSVRTIKRNQDWKDDFSFWMSAYKNNPDSLNANYSLGSIYQNKGSMI